MRPEWSNNTKLRKSEYIDSGTSISKRTDSRTKSSQASTSNFHKNSKNSLQGRASNKVLQSTQNLQDKGLKIAIDDLDCEQNEFNPFKNNEPINISTIPAISSANLWAKSVFNDSQHDAQSP